MLGIVFVLPNYGADQIHSLSSLDIDADWRNFNDGPNCWILQTFLLLRASGMDVELSSNAKSGCINFIHNSHAELVSKKGGEVLIGVRADYPYRRIFDFHVVQNMRQVGRRAVWVPHWPQPGLISRDPGRGCSVRTLGYFGREINVYSRFFHRPSGFFAVRDRVLKIADALGLALIQRGPNNWNDFRDVDIVLGLRSFDAGAYDTKPPSKMTNAWLAGIPFVGGGDSAFSQVGRVGIDYVRVTSERDLIASLERLCCDHEFYCGLVREGWGMSKVYDRPSIVSRWTNLIYSLQNIYL